LIPFTAWHIDAAPPVQPFLQAIPSIKLPFNLPAAARRNAFAHSSKPLQRTGFISTSIFCTSFACITPSVTPPVLPNTLP
jgi:hypothetical protein